MAFFWNTERLFWHRFWILLRMRSYIQFNENLYWSVNPSKYAFLNIVLVPLIYSKNLCSWFNSHHKRERTLRLSLLRLWAISHKKIQSRKVIVVNYRVLIWHRCEMSALYNFSPQYIRISVIHKTVANTGTTQKG